MLLLLHPLPHLKALRDHEVLGNTPVRLWDQFQRLDEWDLDILTLLLDQRSERLGGDFLEVGELQWAFKCGEDFGDGDGVRRVEGGDEGQVAMK